MNKTATPGTWIRWAAFAVAIVGILVVIWACMTEWGGIVHGHPAYAILLVVTLIGCVAVAALTLRAVRARIAMRRGWRRGIRLTAMVVGVLWIAAVAWLRPHTAVEPALAAMNSDAAVSVTESATEIVMTPTGESEATAVFFQPGALVDARAYAAVLRPLAEAGHTVVIPKQPLGIAFFALGAFDGARPEFPDVEGWVVGGHSLGGTVAAIEADSTDVAADPTAPAPAVGLLLYASYPASDISGSLSAAVASISGTQDGLATPEKVAASRADLPADTVFTVIEGASHAQFGAYGPQSGDNEPEISDADAREQISEASVTFVASLSE